MVLFVVNERQQGYPGRAVRASILAHTCLTHGLEVSFICSGREVHDCLVREGSSGVRIVEEKRLVTESALEKPTVLVWDAPERLSDKDVRLFHQHHTFVIEFDAGNGESYADEVVNGFEPLLVSALGRRFQLVGPDHFVVDKCFVNAREWRRASSFLRNDFDLFLCFEGTDPEQLVATLDVLTEIPACRSVQIRLMSGLDETRSKTIQRHFSSFKNLQVYTGANPALMAQLMRFSRLGIISFGPLLVKAMAAELPVVLINSTEEEQEQAARVFGGVFTGAGKTFGYGPSVDWAAFRTHVALLLERPREMERMQEAAHRLVDGQGAQRIARYIQNYSTLGVTRRAAWVTEREPLNVIRLYQ